MEFASKVTCTTCGTLVESKGGPKRFCAPCARNRLLDRKRVNNKRGNARSGVVLLGASLPCAACGQTFIKSGPGKRYCSDLCRSSVRLMGGLGSRDCAQCRASFAKTSPSQRFCSPCGAENLKAARRSNQAKHRPRYRQQISYVLNERMRAGIRQSLTGQKQGRKWTILVGYSAEELRRHLQRQFLPGMTWENIGKWHIDHIVPLASFRFSSTDDEEFAAAWALTNLRPLWSERNLSKGCRRTLLI